MTTQNSTIGDLLTAAAMAGVVGLGTGLAAPAAALAGNCDWNLITDTGPSARHGASLVFDSNRGVFVMWGGRDLPTYFRETWEWDGSQWMLASTDGPVASAQAAVAFDSTRNVTIVYGGSVSTGRTGETWEWNAASWQLAVPLSGGPGFRNRAAMAFDSTRGVAVLYGGQGVGNVNRSDTWEYNGSTWMQIAAGGPGPRYAHMMAYDQARGQTILFGGTAGAGNFNDTWAWDGQTWTQVATSGPEARRFAAMSYDPERGMIVLFSGYDGANDLGDTWEWDGTSWSPVVIAGSEPAARRSATMASGPDGFTLLHGGTSNIATYSDTWGYDCSGQVCYANCDGNLGTEPILTVDDFTCFINEFASAQGLPHEQQIVHYANCDGSTSAPALTVDDFTCFINEFAQGCP